MISLLLFNAHAWEADVTCDKKQGCVIDFLKIENMLSVYGIWRNKSDYFPCISHNIEILIQNMQKAIST